MKNKYSRRNLIILASILYACQTGCGTIVKSEFSFHPDTCELSICNSANRKAKNENEVEVCACKTWNVSNFKVYKEEKYSFRVKDVIEPWQDGELPANPHDGWLANKFFGWIASFLKRDGEAKWYQLVGSIGKGQNARTFLPLNFYGEIDDQSLDEKIHNEYLFPNNQFLTIEPDEEDAELYFYANDAEGRYINNKGILVLEIIRTPIDRQKNEIHD
ncbi:hypothetical protein ACH5Y9_01120 [Methylomonas sp. BW4-1]|uniref:hypothetical protein n=1 Tax=Methylomonas sp. BW4-1 TaxID=3376685 RepID=UPI0040420BC8